MRYFELYRDYYELLDESIAAKAFELSENVNQDAKNISLYVNKVSANPWKESGAPIIKNTILSNIESSCTKLIDFINQKLVSVCNLAINKLCPLINEIKNNDEKLALIESKLSTLNTEKRRLESKIRLLQTNDENNTLIEQQNSRILNSLKNQISDLITEKNNLIVVLENYCKEAKNTISTILKQNGYDQFKINSFLPKYNDAKNETEIMNKANDGTFDVVDERLVENDEEGPYYIVSFSNGRKMKLYDQKGWDNPKGHLRIKSSKSAAIIKMGGSGCSIFAMGSTLTYLTGNMDINMKELAKSAGVVNSMDFVNYIMVAQF